MLMKTENTADTMMMRPGPRRTSRTSRRAIKRGSSIEDAAEFLCRSGSVDDVARKAPRTGLEIKTAKTVGGGRMTTVAKLLERKQQLLERLHGNPGPDERDEIERLIAQIDTALDLLDDAGPDQDQ